MASGHWNSDSVVYAYDSDWSDAAALMPSEYGKVPPGSSLTVAARCRVPY